MTFPEFSNGGSPAPSNNGATRKDPNEYLPWDRCVELKDPAGNVRRPGVVMIVRPIEAIKDWRQEEDWKKLVVADIATLDPIGPGADEYGMPLPGFPAGHQFRNTIIFPGRLNKAFRNEIGKTLIGTVYLGANEKGKPPYEWMSLAGLEHVKERGHRFFMAFPGFLIPMPRQVPEPVAPVSQDPWAQSPTAPSQSAPPTSFPAPAPGVPNYAQYPTPYSDPYTVTSPHAPSVYGGPVASAPPQYAQQPPAQPQYQQQPAQNHATPVSASPAYQGDPWAQSPTAPSQSAPPTSPPQTGAHPHQGMSTLDQMRATLAAQGQPQAPNGDPPF